MSFLVIDAKSCCCFFYLHQGGYVLPAFVCEFVYEQDNSKTYRQILMKFSGYI